MHSSRLTCTDSHQSSSKTQLLTLYFLDSGAYSKSAFDFFGMIHGLEYDWIHQVCCSYGYDVPLRANILEFCRIKSIGSWKSPVSYYVLFYSWY